MARVPGRPAAGAVASRPPSFLPLDLHVSKTPGAEQSMGPLSTGGMQDLLSKVLGTHTPEQGAGDG